MLKSPKTPFLMLTAFLGLAAFTTTSASVKQMGEEDVIFNVSKKLAKIEQRLKDQSVLVSPDTLNWPELEAFNNDLMFVVAHDPLGPILKETPEELSSEKLTEKLRYSWINLEESTVRIGAIAQSSEWIQLKEEMEQFLNYRKNLLYQPARVMIKTGVLSTKILALKSSAASLMKDSPQGRKVSLRIIDPVLEELTKELHVLNASVSALEELRRPKRVVQPSIFEKKNTAELTLLGSAAFVAGLVLTGLGVGTVALVKRFKDKNQKLKEKTLAEVKPLPTGFNYSEWLKGLEKKFQALKKNEDVFVEDLLCLINYAAELKEARKNFLQEGTEQEKVLQLQALNSASTKIEDYLEKLKLKKNSEISKGVMRHLIELCEAIETGVEINVSEKAKTLRHVA